MKEGRSSEVMKYFYLLLTTFSNTFRVSSAHFFHEKRFAFFFPRFMSSARNSESVSTRMSPSAIDSGLCGSTNIAESPRASASPPSREATTGHPQASASRGGKPNPSKKDG